ncbi:MFS transporter [Dactylosporangium sp. CA-233914]|uniref:MFS transporter n=1 Tax=Dactylosporangium sp. CA-233914 TaxID=3239934 RepID=UPI003D90CF67
MTHDSPSAPQAFPTRTLAALVVAVTSYSLMQTLVVPGLSVIRHDLHASPGWGAWILSAFLISSAVATPVFARLGDLHGHGRVVIAVLAIYAIGTVVAAAAPSIEVLIAGRVLQGPALSLVPLAFAVAHDAVPLRHLHRTTALLSGLMGGGAGIGLVLGGVITDHASWRSLFILSAGLAVLSLILVLSWVPRGAATTAGSLDWPGTLLLAATLVCLLVTITQGGAWGWTSPASLCLNAATVLLAVSLTMVERRSPRPLLDIAEFAYRPVLTTHLAAFLWGAMSYLFYVALPAFALAPRPQGFASTVTTAGLIMLPGALTVLIGSTLAHRLGYTLGHRWPLGIGFR